ncbi:MAG: alpha/beta hydrolase family esterase [Myxococcota bacterium]
MWFSAFAIACLSKPQQDSQESPIPDEPEAYVSPDEVTEKRSLMHQNLNRDYWLHIPSGLPESAPLWIVMHGYSDGAESMMNWSNLNTLADEKKFAVAYPQGTIDDNGFAFFNVGYAFHGNQTVDDLDFIRVLISELQSEYRLSADNVFATGLSNGGDMSYYLACEASDVFQAIAPVAGTMMSHIFDNCSPDESIPVFEIHGTEDDVTLWDGDLTNQYGWGSYMDTDSVMAFWAAHNNLEEQSSVMLEDTTAGDGSVVRFERYYSGESPIEVWLYAVEGGGHDWPGIWGNMDIDSGAEIWGFFDQMSVE